MAKKDAKRQAAEEDRTFAIQEARYGRSNTEAESDDVTERVAALVKGDKLALKVDGVALGARRKFAGTCRLFVSFTVGERELRASAGQGKELRLP